MSDEALRRRALFEHERDGVMILSPDGSVFEANPQCAALLGYPMEELQRLCVSDWDIQSSRGTTARRLESVGAGGRILETVLRR